MRARPLNILASRDPVAPLPCRLAQSAAGNEDLTVAILANACVPGGWDSDPAVYLAVVLALGLVAQWTAWRFRLPAILLLLIFGFLAGRFFHAESILGTDLLFPLVSMAVGVILFEGGLTLRFHELRSSGGPVLRLCTIGAFVTWALATAAGVVVLGWPAEIAAVLGAILTVTGPTVIAPLLRHIKPQRRVGAIAKWEGIVVDPIGAIAAVLLLLFVGTADGEGALQGALQGIVMTLLVGGGLAVLMARALEFFLKHHWIPDYLHALAFLACGAVVFVGANRIQHESGLLAVTLLGILLANQKSASVKHILEFKEHLRVLLISMLFIVLAGRIDPAALVALGWRGPAFVLVLVVVVRPACVFLSTMGSELAVREKIFLCCLAPRGIVAAAVASIFSLQILSAHQGSAPGSPGAELAAAAAQLSPLVFLVIVGTVLIYGLAAAPVARRLGLAAKNPQGVLFAGTPWWAIETGVILQEEGFQVLFVDTSRRGIAAARMRGLPTCLANILSEFVEEEVELAGLGKFLAATPNDEVNSLSALEFRHVFGQENIYRLKAEEADAPGGKRRGLAPEHRGQILFPGQPTSSEMIRQGLRGAVVKRSRITEEFSYHDFEAMHQDFCSLLFVLKEGARLVVATEGFRQPEAGDTVLALVKTPKAEEDGEKAASKGPQPI